MLTHVFYFLFLLTSYVNYSTGFKPNLSLILGTLESVRRLEKILNFLGMEPWLSVRQADALTAGPTMLTHVLSYLLAM